MNLWIDAGLPLFIHLSSADEKLVTNGQAIDLGKYNSQIREQLENTIKGNSSNQAKRIARSLLAFL